MNDELTNNKVTPGDDITLQSTIADEDFPNVPKRETVSTPPNHIFGVPPPAVHRDVKPLSPKLPPKIIEKPWVCSVFAY